MLRRSAIVLAATSALVLTATAPALANHADPFATFDAEDVQGGNLKTCEGLVEEALADAGYDAELFWEKSQDNVDSVDDVFEHRWFDLELSPDLKRLTVTAHSVPEGDFLVVLVKGGNATNMFIGPDLDDLYAPVNESGDHARISNYTICKFKGQKGEEETPTPTPTTTTTTTPTTTPTPETTEAPEPETSKSPAPVPTAVPAGASGSGDASMGSVGVVAAALMVMVGGAALLRRRFARQN